MEELQEYYYYIKEAAHLTGLSEQLIRKWENRYHIIQPKRLDNGYRVYTMDDLLVLKRLRELRDEGKSMKQAIQILIAKKKSDKQKYHLNQMEASEYVDKLIEKGTVYDEDGVMFLLIQANHQYGLDLFLQNTVQPFMEKIGELWATSEWDESQETISSLVVKDFLTQISRNFNNHSEAPHALGFCLPDELHEIPLQMLLLQMKMRGWRTTQVGASPKFSAIERLVERMNPKKVLLSASTVTPFQKDENLMENLDRVAFKYPDTAFYIGGRGVWDYTEIVRPKHLHISYTVDDVFK